MKPEVPAVCWEDGKGAAPTSIWFCCGVFTSHSVGTWLRLSAGRKSLGSAISERESGGDEKRELLLESSSRYEESWNRGTAMVGGGRMKPESSFLTHTASSNFFLLNERKCPSGLNTTSPLLCAPQIPDINLELRTHSVVLFENLFLEKAGKALARSVDTESRLTWAVHSTMDWEREEHPTRHRSTPLCT